jgi:CRISPR-associated protein (TIGR03986 family)
VNPNTFVNPYTFIPLGNGPIRERRTTDDLTGVLRCTLETMTPLIIPNAGNEHAFPAVERTVTDRWNVGNPGQEGVRPGEHKSYDFFSYEAPQGDRSEQYPQPVIPGSSLRGVIRSAYEAVTDSCMSTVDEETPLHRRSPEPYKKYGIIENGVLYAAEKVLIHTDAAWHRSWPAAPQFARNGSPTTPRLATGAELWVSKSGQAFASSRGFSTGNEWVTAINAPGTGEKGYFLAGERFGTGNQKHFDAVMVKEIPNKVVYTLTQDDKDRLLALHNLYQPSYSGWIDAGHMPVYYDEVGGKYYFSPACISQEVLHRKLGDMLGDFKPCANTKTPCEACSVFGMVAGNDGAIASRVSFSDALPVNCVNPADWFDEPKTLPILGTPHITSTEFYQVDPDPNADYYNADYKVTRQRGNTTKVALSDAESRIRGRKFYWHGEPQLAVLDREKPNQNNTFRAVKQGKKFSFEVRFERLTETELAKLIWVLEIGGGDNLAHKLGHGKPVGYGSVRIRADREKSAVFAVDDMLNITESPLPALPERSKLDIKHYKEFVKVTNYAERPSNSAYPTGTVGRETTIYSWFGLNRQGGETKNRARDQNRAKIFNTLPNVLDEVQELPKYKPNGNEPLSRRYESNRAEPRVSQSGDSQRQISPSYTTQPTTTTLEDVFKLQETSKAKKTEQQYGTYRARDFETWLVPWRRDSKTMRNLRAFVDDYERAERENDGRYSALSHLYEQAKEKLKK